jgi:hypothetical protein
MLNSFSSWLLLLRVVTSSDACSHRLIAGAGPMDSLGATSVVVEGAREARHFADA